MQKAAILCVDDDPLVRDVTRAVLERCGHAVVLADDAEQAVRLLQRMADRVSLVLLDWTVSGGGGQAIARLKGIRPDIKILLTSGYSREEVLSALNGHRVEGFLEKPYLPKDLVAQVERIIRATPRRVARRATAGNL